MNPLPGPRAAAGLDVLRPPPIRIDKPTSCFGPMEYRKLGRTGLDVSVLGFGSWVSFDYQLQLDQAKSLVKSCFDAGVNFFDTAEVYAHGKSELILGQIFKELAIPRCDLVVSTKIYFGDTANAKLNARGLSRKHIIEGLKASLHRLQLDYVDIVFAHRPDDSVPMEEIVRSFNYVIDHGMSFYWGTSEWPVHLIEEACGVADKLNMIGPVAEQTQYSILHRKRVEIEYKDVYARHGTGVTAFSPLACGILTGKYSAQYRNTVGGGDDGTEGNRFTLQRYKFLAERWLQKEKLDAVDHLLPIANDLGATPAQLALAWCAANPNVSSVLMGATQTHQLEENLGSLKFLSKLTPDIMERIDLAVGGNSELELGKQPNVMTK